MSIYDNKMNALKISNRIAVIVYRLTQTQIEESSLWVDHIEEEGGRNRGNGGMMIANVRQLRKKERQMMQARQTKKEIQDTKHTDGECE